jgi:hypothetical protein
MWTLDADVAVCTDCGTLHLAGDPGPYRVQQCGTCGGTLAEVTVRDLLE